MNHDKVLVATEDAMEIINLVRVDIAIGTSTTERNNLCAIKVNSHRKSQKLLRLNAKQFLNTLQEEH